jgi:hypothetical protein
MPQFTVIPRRLPTRAIVANPKHLLNIVSEMGCDDADILCDGEYAFSVQRGGNGMWILSGRRGT